MVMVSPKHTDHEFAPTPEREHDHVPASLPEGFHSITVAETSTRRDVLLRTITAPCTEVPLADLIAQTCAPTLAAICSVLPHFHVLELEVIGFVLP
ncbi:hypothetical protein [Streptomyces atrovirens]|uniref:Uncharacterized protein n=1 Tax=Streptomyces atrovirens TaxID=285556 RepID=A0ABW0DZF5_9ACTN